MHNVYITDEEYKGQCYKIHDYTLKITTPSAKEPSYARKEQKILYQRYAETKDAISIARNNNSKRQSKVKKSHEKKKKKNLHVPLKDEKNAKRNRSLY